MSQSRQLLDGKSSYREIIPVFSGYCNNAARLSWIASHFFAGNLALAASISDYNLRTVSKPEFDKKCQINFVYFEENIYFAAAK